MLSFNVNKPQRNQFATRICTLGNSLANASDPCAFCIVYMTVRLKRLNSCTVQVHRKKRGFTKKTTCIILLANIVGYQKALSKGSVYK